MNKLEKAIAISAKVRRLIKAKVQIAEVISGLGPLEATIIPSLKKAQFEIEFRILILKNIISKIILGLPGYDFTRHIEINYISEADLKEGFIDLAMADIDTDYLDLTTGDILTPEEVPEEKRNRQLVSPGGINT